MMSGSSDDVPARTRGAVRPPPSLSPADTPAIDVPRMSPPPPSLEALVTSTGRLGKPQRQQPASWWLWLVVALLTAAVTAYVMR